MTNTDMLNEKIDFSGLKRKFIANVLGISISSLANKIYNRTEFTVPEMDKLSTLLNLSDKEKSKIFLNRK